jgi:signal transduction histidine kinase
MPENNLQADLSPADRWRQTDPTAPLLQGLYNESGPWAEMLARIGDKHGRLYRRVQDREAVAGRRILAEIEKERTRIGRELHAGAGQPLAGIIQNLQMLEEYSAELPPQTKAILSRLVRLAEQALGQVRAVSHRLYPPDWQKLSLEDALRQLVETGVPSDRYEVTFRSDALPFEPSHFARIALYRCAQECISNILRHAGATRFGLSVRHLGGTIELDVRDNGSGISDSSGAGIGIASLHEAARMLGGSCHISSSAEGTRVTIRVPLAVD